MITEELKNLLSRILYYSNIDHCYSSDDLQNNLERIHELLKEKLPFLKEEEE
jgi:hypothetical protein